MQLPLGWKEIEVRLSPVDQSEDKVNNARTHSGAGFSVSGSEIVG